MDKHFGCCDISCRNNSIFKWEAVWVHTEGGATGAGEELFQL